MVTAIILAMTHTQSMIEIDGKSPWYKGQDVYKSKVQEHNSV